MEELRHSLTTLTSVASSMGQSPAQHNIDLFFNFLFRQEKGIKDQGYRHDVALKLFGRLLL